MGVAKGKDRSPNAPIHQARRLRVDGDPLYRHQRRLRRRERQADRRGVRDPAGAHGQDPPAAGQAAAGRQHQRAQGRLRAGAPADRDHGGPGDPSAGGADQHRLVPGRFRVPADGEVQPAATRPQDPGGDHAGAGHHEPGRADERRRAGTAVDQRVVRAAGRSTAEASLSEGDRTMGLKFPIFMDAQSTTPCDPRVVEAMLPYFTEKFGHPASRNHPFGWEAEGAVDAARAKIAALIGARDPKELVFTSGGTEAINLALKGVAEMYKQKGNHIVTTVIEQRASIDTFKRLERQGFQVTYVPVQPDGLIDVEEIRKALTDKTILISVMFANNEIGTIQDVTAIGKLAKGKGILFHTDATQAVGKIPVDVEAMGIDLLSCTAHLIYGPKGVGALYVRRKGPRVRIAPMMDGGGHERGMRSGTLPVPLIVAFGNVEGESVLMGLNKETALSSGSACTSSTLEPSYVIAALGASAELAHSSIRFSLHRFTTEEEVEHVGTRTIDVVKRLREMSPLYELAKEGVDLKSIRWKAD